MSNLAARLALDYVQWRLAESSQAQQSLDPAAAPSNDARSTFLAELTRARHEYLSAPQQPGAAPPTSASRGLCEPKDWPLSAASAPFSYGKLVALVDFTLDPWTLFQSAGAATQWQSVEQNLSPDFLGSKTRLDNWTLFFRYLTATHNNPRHFQGQALDEFYGFNDAALSAARADGADPKGTMLRSLAYGAVADHFLEDSLAPGHDLTPRDGMYDAVALSWHDAFNDRGRVIASLNWNELSPLFEYAMDHASEMDADFQAVGSHMNQRRRNAIPLDQALGHLENEHEQTCFVGKPSGLNALLGTILDPRAEFYAGLLNVDPHLLEDLRDPATPTGTINTVSFCTHGDGSLSRGVFHARAHTTDTGEAQTDLTHDAPAWEVADQKVFMMLVEAKYMVDRLVTFAMQRKVDLGLEPLSPAQTDQHLWCPIMMTTDKLDSKAADLPCNQLMHQAIPLCSAEGAPSHVCKQVVMLPTAMTRYFAYVSTPTDEDSLVGATSDYRNFVYAVHIGEVPATRRVAPVLGVELGIPDVRHFEADAHNAVAYQKAFPLTFFGALGWEWHLADTQQNSQAFTMRLMTQLPSIDLQFGGYGKLEDVGNDITRRWRWGYGMRLDQGFSLFSLYVLLGWEPTLNEPVRTTKAFAVGAGLSISMNGRRIARAVTGTTDTVKGWFGSH